MTVPPGVTVKNIVLCFDHTDEHPGFRDASNTEMLFRLLDGTDQLTWYHSGTAIRNSRRIAPGRHGDSVSEARAAIVEAYRFLGDAWDPGDRIFVFGGGEGGHRAGELATLLGTVGLLPAHSEVVLDYALATYVLPRTPRTPQDWRQIRVLAAQLVGDRDPAVPVRFVGLWNATATRGTKQRMGPLPTVESGRHAVAVDGGRRTMRYCEHLDEVWFRGTRRDVAGGTERVLAAGRYRIRLDPGRGDCRGARGCRQDRVPHRSRRAVGDDAGDRSVPAPAGRQGARQRGAVSAFASALLAAPAPRVSNGPMPSGWPEVSDWCTRRSPRPRSATSSPPSRRDMAAFD